MRTAATCLIICLCLSFCKKQKDGGSSSSATNSNGNPSQSFTPSFINVTVNDLPMEVKAIHYNRGGASFNFSAENPLQKVDVYCFRFYGRSGFNYQYSDSINYSSRPDTLAAWFTRRAANWGDVSFDCCAFPITDAVISGNFSGTFPDTKSVTTVKGNFQLKF